MKGNPSVLGSKKKTAHGASITRGFGSLIHWRGSKRGGRASLGPSCRTFTGRQALSFEVVGSKGHDCELVVQGKEREVVHARTLAKFVKCTCECSVQ